MSEHVRGYRFITANGYGGPFHNLKNGGCAIHFSGEPFKEVGFGFSRCTVLAEGVECGFLLTWIQVFILIRERENQLLV